MVVKDVPPLPVLIAHVDTALDAASLWMRRSLHAAEALDDQGWEDGAYFSRVLLTQAAYRFSQLGWVATRDEREAPEDLQAAYRAANAYGREVLTSLTEARLVLKDVTHAGMDAPGAVDGLGRAQQELGIARTRLRDMSHVLEFGRDPDPAPTGPTLHLVRGWPRDGDGGLDLETG